jgi:hypothetical protein
MTTTQRKRYTPHQQFTNNLAASIFGLEPKPFSGTDWLAADIEANVRKAEKAHAHNERMALKDQNKYQGML